MHLPVLHEHYKTDSPVEFTVKEKVVNVSGESYNITDSEGNVIFKMDGHALSIRDRCVLKDHHGHPILNARKKLTSLHERWEVCSGEHFESDNVVFYVVKSSLVQFKTHLRGYFAGNDDKNDPDFEVKGNFFERQAQIVQGDEIVAEVKRKYTAGNVIMDKHTFDVVVSPGVDHSFVFALVIIMDRIHD